MADLKLTSDDKVSSRVRYWLGEIEAARKREKEWRKDGKRILQIYEGGKAQQTPFNILYSNTETLQPALYNSQPRPVVQRRFKDEDPLGKAAATAGQRALEFQLDTNSEEYDPFDNCMSDAVLDALLPGRGATRLRYDYQEGRTKYGAEDGAMVTDELTCYESLKWDRWIHGYAKKWSKVPWVAFEHEVGKKEAESLFGKAKADLLVFNDKEKATDDDESGDKTEEDVRVARVYEVWVKETKKVLFVSPNCKVLLKEDDDPLELTGFYPMPEPLRFLRKSNNLMPTALYILYENQAKEINRLTQRINKIAEAIKVRGAYDGTLGEISNILNADDNVMVAAENVAALSEGGLEKAIWLIPIDKLIIVLQQLILARQQAKQTVYEVTGISDILRGQSVASETATAQNIKNQWGTLRLKRMQRDVQRYARELLRITLEISKRFSEDTWASMTGLPFAKEQEVAAAQQQVAAARAFMMPIPPEAQAVLQKPQWSQVLGMLRDSTQRAYRIDIETNSTIDLEATEDQKNIGEVLQAISQFISGIAPLVINGSMPFQVAQAMLLGIIRRYKFGTEVEDYIKQMQPPKPPDDGKKQEMAAKLQMEQQKHQADMAQAQQKMAHEKELMAMDLQVKQEELKLKKAEMAMKLEYQQLMGRLKMMEGQQKLQLAERQGQMQLQQGAQQHEQDMASQRVQNAEKERAAAAAAKAKPAPAGKK